MEGLFKTGQFQKIDVDLIEKKKKIEELWYKYNGFNYVNIIYFIRTREGGST